MKTMKVALLATVAFAAVTVGARADDTAALKAELEALNARVAQLKQLLLFQLAIRCSRLPIVRLRRFLASPKPARILLLMATRQP